MEAGTSWLALGLGRLSARLLSTSVRLRAHVYAITRRGYGASSQPATGYDDQRLADDVRAVIEALKLEAPVVAGHSMGGGEITTLARQHSDRLGGLIYLDAIGDPRDFMGADPAWRALLQKLPPRREPACPDDQRSFVALREAWHCRELCPQCGYQIDCSDPS